MTSFIEQQQELARKELDKQFRYGLQKQVASNFDDCTPEVRKMLDTLITQIITNTGEELMKLSEGERRDQDAPKPGDLYFTGCGGCGEQYPAICGCREVNHAIDTIKQHIINVTGVE